MNSTVNLQSLTAKIQHSIRVLIQELKEDKKGFTHWTGKLSDSALSTATAISALSVCQRDHPSSVQTNLMERGSIWLSQSQNDDGGFGDTDRSLSNIATTLLVLAAWKLAGYEDRYARQVEAAWNYVHRMGNWDGLRRRYGKDKTFVVPIMTNCAIAGLVDWKQIPTLPFEAAALPQSWYRLAQMPVVSYAIPALVAIGQAQFVHSPPSNPLLYGIRKACRKRTLRVLERMQPESGGYLEATPLTSFVLMSLASIGLGNHPVAKNAIRFLLDSVMPDGSWPIDTNLATWVTSLTTTNYYEARGEREPLDSNFKTEWTQTVDWILSCQHMIRHPFTGAEPGGWGWTDLSGSVPDSDDTPAALIALAQYVDHRPEHHQKIVDAAKLGCRWLLKLQNRDGGWPTFCKGWGKLPFDRSGSDLTAHAIRALAMWQKQLPSSFQSAMEMAIERGWHYLEKHQNPDGSWLPLWFGNQDRAEEDNPFYGTARVLLSYAQCGKSNTLVAQRGLEFLTKSQNSDGGWGGGSSIEYCPFVGNSLKDSPIPTPTSTIEETAIVLEGIIACHGKTTESRTIMRGLDWLSDAIMQGKHHTSQPIGFYFAKLWYYERHYPLAFSLSALRKGLEFCQR